jgi:DNA-binding beta-propeller fold protein YncE
MTIEKRAFPSLSLTLLLVLSSALYACGSGSGGAADESASEATVGPDRGVPDFAQLPNPYTVTRDWGTVPPGRQAWGRVSGVAMDPDGVHVWVAERCGGDVCLGSDVPVVLEYAPDGTLVKSFGGGIFMRPHGMYVDPSGNVWVTDVRSPRPEELKDHPGDAHKGNQVVKFSPDGDVLMVIGTPGEAGDPADGKLNQPNDVVTVANGDIYISEGHSPAGPGRISRFSSDGKFLDSFGDPGDGPGQFRVPHALATDGHGHLFVADRSNNRVQIFDLQGNFLAQWHQFGRPSDVHITADGRIFTIDYESGPDLNPGFLRGVYMGNALTGQVTGFVPGHKVDNDPLGLAGEGIVRAADGTLYAGEVMLNGLSKYSMR